jgi:hypothetical protein
MGCNLLCTKRQTNFHSCNSYLVYVSRPYFTNFNTACIFYSVSDQVSVFCRVKLAGGVERALRFTVRLSADIFMKGEESILCLNCNTCLYLCLLAGQSISTVAVFHTFFFFRNWKKAELGSHSWNCTKSKYLNYTKDLMKKQRKLIKVILNVGRCKRSWMPFKERRR